MVTLHKSYEALDWERSLDLITAYGVGPRTVRLLRTYWGLLTMVAKSGGYFGHPFKGYQGVTQGDPMYPTIFNVVVDAVICHWVTVVTPTEEGTVFLGLMIIYMLSYFCANDSLVESTQQERVHRFFGVLSGLFNRLFLWTNTVKTVGMVCQPFHAPRGGGGRGYPMRDRCWGKSQHFGGASVWGWSAQSV